MKGDAGACTGEGGERSQAGIQNFPKEGKSRIELVIQYGPVSGIFREYASRSSMKLGVSRWVITAGGYRETGTVPLPGSRHCRDVVE